MNQQTLPPLSKKIIIIGANGTGKTSLLYKFQNSEDNTNIDQHSSTTNIYTQLIDDIRCSFWDFPHFSDNVYKDNAQGIIMVIDNTKLSMDYLIQRYHQIKDKIVMICLNKSDLFSNHELEQTVNKIKDLFTMDSDKIITTSIIHNININKMFIQTAHNTPIQSPIIQETSTYCLMQ